MAEPTNDRKRAVSDGLEAVAEALVLADPSDLSTIEDLLSAVRRLRDIASQSDQGAGARTAMDDAEAAIESILSGDLEIEAGLSRAAKGFETARSSLTHTPALERSRAGSQTSTDSTMVDRANNPLADDPGLVSDFVSRSIEHLDSADSLLLRLEQSPDDREVLDAVFRIFHTIKGMAGFLGFAEIEKFAHDSESFLDGPRKGREPFTPEAFDAVFAAVDAIRGLISARAGESTDDSDRVGGDTLTERRANGSETLPSGAAASNAPSMQTRSGSRGRRAADAIVRVEEERLDLLLDTIGELVIAEAMTSEAARTNTAAWEVLGDKFSRLDKITRELQEMATSLRMVPLKSTFGRMARLVRDLSQKANKPVTLLTEGEDTEIDKAVVDLIYDPLVHLVRNAVDHGIEGVSTRTRFGKSAAGCLTLRAFHAGGSVCVELEDDGAGLDPDAILTRARSQGLVTGDDELTAREIHELIFRAGFSTAREVTDVSGRGVGMDVVKRAVEGLRGTIEVHSERGTGTRFTLRLPLTLAIIDGMVLRIGRERYILPTLTIQRSLRPEPSDLSNVLGRGEVLATDEGMVPLVRLARLLDVAEEDPDPTEGIVVLVGGDDDRVGLVASELLGQQQTVIKPLGDSMNDTPGVSGGAIMPDGQVGLILDVAGIVKLAHTKGGE